MKKFRKLIPALALLLVSAVLMSTASYAWFSMNTQVTATGMQVTAKSDTTFLLIQKTESVTGANEAEKAASVQSTALTTVALTVDDADADVYPSKPYNATSDNATYTTTASTASTVNSYTTAAVPGNWFTAVNGNPANSTGDIQSDHVLASFSDYVIKKSVTLTLSAGSENAHNLTVTGSILPKGLVKVSEAGTAASGKTYYSYADGVYTNINAVADSTPITTSHYVLNAGSGPATINLTAVKVLVVTDNDNMATLDYSTTAAQSLHTTVDTTLNTSTTIVVDIYIYYDGSAAAVFTNNKANLGNAVIDLTFDVTVDTGA